MAKKMIVGLGNPGAKFGLTYHNVGVLALEAIKEALEKESAPANYRTYKNLFKYASIGNYILILPLTFMNESGSAVKEAMKKFTLPALDLIVAHDESDVTLGEYKISTGKNSAGHKGVQSIMDAIHEKNFTRARIGVREKNETNRQKASEFVLKEISVKDKKTLDGVFIKIIDELLT